MDPVDLEVEKMLDAEPPADRGKRAADAKKNKWRVRLVTIIIFLLIVVPLVVGGIRAILESLLEPFPASPPTRSSLTVEVEHITPYGGSGATLPYNLVMVKAIVSCSSHTPTGTVTFEEGTTIVGEGSLTNGTVEVPLADWHRESDIVTVTYYGDVNCGATTTTFRTSTGN